MCAIPTTQNLSWKPLCPIGTTAESSAKENMDMSLRIWTSAISVGIVVVLLTASVQAHHSIPAYYDESKTISVTGVVRQVRIMNPHSSILIDGGPANGPKGVWL